MAYHFFEAMKNALLEICAVELFGRAQRSSHRSSARVFHNKKCKNNEEMCFQGDKFMPILISYNASGAVESAR
jgi:hypothetical protein